MKKIFTLMAVCLLALVSGCGGQQSSAPEPADKGPVELHVSAAASLTDDDNTQKNIVMLVGRKVSDISKIEIGRAHV